jgi:dsDNA-specific endonuclease/ATPase MutS2
MKAFVQESYKLNLVSLLLPIYVAEKSQLPKVGDMVYVSSLGRKGTVLRLEPSKDEIVVQTGNMKLKLKLTDIGK